MMKKTLCCITGNMAEKSTFSRKILLGESGFSNPQHQLWKPGFSVTHVHYVDEGNCKNPVMCM